MESFDLEPTARVFHIDTECYVIYIGSEPDDYRPFLRIGNSPHLPEKVTDYVNPIVITDTFTGNPLLESGNLGHNSAVENRYIGDPKTVELLKDFVGRQSVSTEGFEYYHGAVTDASGVFVYFYSDGNVTVKYGKTELFNLRRREQQDHHYLERVRQIKNNFERNPLKYTRDTYTSPGFIFVDDTVAVFNKGDMAMLGVWEDYFLELAVYGIDPDKVGVVVADTPDTALLRLAKRSRAKSNSVTVFSKSPGVLEGFLELFASDGPKPLSYSVKKLTSEPTDGFATYRLGSADDGFGLELRGAARQILVRSAGKGQTKPGKDLLLDPKTNTVARGSDSSRVPVGVPCRLIEAAPNEDDLYRQYLPGKTTNLRELIGADAHGAITNLIAFLDEVRQKREGSKYLKNARAAMRSLNPAPEVLACYSLNVAEICSVLSANRDYAALARVLESAADQIRSDVGSLDKVEPSLPLVADLYLTEDRFHVFYRFSGLLSTSKLEQAAAAQQKMQTAAVVEADYEAERKRLLDLVSGLADPDVQLQKLMTKISEEKTHEAKKQSPDKKAADKTASPGQRAAGTSQTAATHGKQTPSSAGAKTSSSSRGTGTGRPSPADAARRAAQPARPRRRSRRGGWIAAAAVLGLLLIAALLWFLDLLPIGTVGERPEGIIAEAAEPSESPEELATDQPQRDADAEADSPAAATPGEPTGRDSGEKPTSEEEVGQGAEEVAPPLDETDTTPEQPLDDGATGGRQSEMEPAAQAGEPDDGVVTSREPVADATDSEIPATDGATEPDMEPPAPEASRNDGRVPPPPPTMTEDEARQTPAFSGAGGIEASIFDIIEMVNRIAVANGYRRMDNFTSDAPDPDWIYPGNVFVLLDGTRYTVQRNDTLWDITVRFVRRSLEEHYRRYRELQEEASQNPGKSTEIVADLEELAASAHVDEFRRMVLETADELRRD